MRSKPLTVGSLFSGIGGLDLGLEWAGMRVVWQVENDPYCRGTLQRLFPDARIWGDIETFPPDADGRGLTGEPQPDSWTPRSQLKASRWRDALRLDSDEPLRDPYLESLRAAEFRRGQAAHQPCVGVAVDLICGGFPCQPVSFAGRQKFDADDRWLWPEMRRVCEVVRPRWVLVENVRGLLSADAGRLFGGVVRDLAALGYFVEWDCIPAAAVGAPHIRDRVFIVGRRDRTDAECGGVRSERHRAAEGETEGVQSEAGERQRVRLDPESMGGHVADAEQRGLSQRGRRSESSGFRGPQPSPCSPPLADADEQGLEGRPTIDGDAGSGIMSAGASGALQEYRLERRSSGQDEWESEPDVGRVADGVPARVDRLKALGNAVVPQVAEFIGRLIVDYESRGAGADQCQT